MSPSTCPSTVMSPEVLTLPLMTRSADSTEAGGLAFGASCRGSGGGAGCAAAAGSGSRSRPASCR